MITTQTTHQERLEKENQALKNEVALLQEQLSWFKKNFFGKRSEKIIKNLTDYQLYLEGFEPGEQPSEPTTQKIASHERTKSKGKGEDKIKLPEDLPVETIVLDIPEKDKVCPETGAPLVKIGEDVTFKLAQKPGSFYLKEIIRPKYALPKESKGGIVTASLPDSIIPKCRADESLLAEILTKKYADHIPITRICEMISREGIVISKQTISSWVIRIGKELKPLYDLMRKQILESENVFVDETPVSMLMPGKGKVHQGYMWVLSGGKIKILLIGFIALNPVESMNMLTSF